MNCCLDTTDPANVATREALQQMTDRNSRPAARCVAGGADMSMACATALATDTRVFWFSGLRRVKRETLCAPASTICLV